MPKVSIVRNLKRKPNMRKKIPESGVECLIDDVEDVCYQYPGLEITSFKALFGM